MFFHWKRLICLLLLWIYFLPGVQILMCCKAYWVPSWFVCEDRFNIRKVDPVNTKKRERTAPSLLKLCRGSFWKIKVWNSEEKMVFAPGKYPQKTKQFSLTWHISTRNMNWSLNYLIWKIKQLFQSINLIKQNQI